MTARSLFETEILPFSLRQATRHLGVQQNIVDVIEQRLDTKTADLIGKAFLEILCDAHPANVEVSKTEFPTGPYESLASRIVNQRNIDGSPQRMDFIKIKDASLTVGISLVSLSIAIATLSSSGAGSALGALKGIYDNWVVLKDNQDTDSMNVYDALLRHAGEVVAECIPLKNFDRPCLKYADLHEFGGPTPEKSIKALKRLKELGLAEVVHWNGPDREVDDPDNKWAIRA